MRRFGLPLLCALVAASACGGDASQGSGSDRRPREAALAGQWRWVTSRHAGTTRRPAGPGDDVVMEIGPWGAYREFSRGSWMKGHYKVAKGQLYQLEDSSFTVLLLDSSRFFPRSAPPSPALAVRALTGDSLLLSGTGTDSTLYSFARVDHPR